jgi:hypothetical protein
VCKTHKGGPPVRVDFLVMLSDIFPSLFEHDGVSSINFESVSVHLSILPAICVTIKARKPIDFLFERAAFHGLPTTWIDKVIINANDDGSICVIER